MLPVTTSDVLRSTGPVLEVVLLSPLHKLRQTKASDIKDRGNIPKVRHTLWPFWYLGWYVKRTCHTYLKADADVDPAAEAGGDGARRQVQRRKELRETRREVDARPLLGDHAQRANAAQIDALGAQRRCGRAESLGAQFHDAVRAKRVSNCKDREAFN